METITIDDLKKIDIRLGTILSASPVPDADKLYVFSIDLGEESPRQILSGIREYYPDPSVLVGKQVPVVANLAPRTIRGLESNGMILYGIHEEENLRVLKTLSPSDAMPNGSVVG